MEFGYMAGCRGDLFAEIDFAKEYFDFVEITIKPEQLENFDSLVPLLKERKGDLRVLGHIHWEILDLENIEKNICLLRDLGAQKITIHPFEKFSDEDNVNILNEIKEFCDKNNTKLLLENISKSPYNSVQVIEKILNQTPGIDLTLDVGHANRASELESFLNRFKGRIGHIHLHDNVGQADHLFFSDTKKLRQILSLLKGNGYSGTILMETFSTMRDGKSISLEELEDIKSAHIKQIKEIKTP